MSDLPQAPATSRHRIDPRKAGIAALACWAGFALFAWAVPAGRTRQFDQLGLMFWRAHDLHPLGPPWVLEWVRDLTAMGGFLQLKLYTIMAFVALFWLRRRREAVLLALTVLSGSAVNALLKLVFGRPRPEIVPHLTEAGGASFPSGHSFNSASTYIALALAFAALSPRANVRHTLIAGSIVLSLMVAWSRVWLGVHWPSDVMAGWLGGAAWTFTASALLYRPARVVLETTGDFSEPDSPQAPPPEN
ncbi:undecaprenyl-diphosphatase [Novosphingobium sp. PhB165]|uniref:phosphatase PAP2 family protein n=1 Tax=Novosphingobium sp. PhB165 TaxID=2485105 RepID=UPI00104FAB77|nr:phosphatase PAP2 family protein [Novosphingobium sp. PhB165]TCM21432.1 undecaprenyl-diphosphatase [Novosphingobium sp. PhB165]